MKIALIGFLFFTASVLVGCDASSSANLHFDPNEIAYSFDEHTDICYAYTGSIKGVGFETTGLGFTEVTCSDKVMALAGK